jgi:hypothetical protein
MLIEHLGPIDVREFRSAWRVCPASTISSISGTMRSKPPFLIRAWRRAISEEDFA